MNSFNIENRIKSLEALLKQVKNSLKFAPDGRLSYSVHGSNYYYYIIDNDKNRKYIPKNNLSSARSLAQRDYNKSLLKKITAELNLLYQLRDNYFDHEQFFKTISEPRRELIKPLITPIDEYISNWQNEEYEGLNSLDKPGEFLTMKNENVRSKSEVLIANELFNANKPYKYEHPLTLSGITYYPDFTVLNTRTRKEMLWEHLGKLDSTDYVSRNLSKLRIYESHGIILGKNLIITCEDSSHPLSVLSIRKKIKEFFD